MRRSPWIVLAAAAVLAAPVLAQDWKGRARLDGHVTDERGAPLGGATITIESLARAGGPPVLRSDAEGAWVVDGIAAGSWIVEVAAPGYQSQRIGVHLPHESAWLAPLDVQLRIRRPPAPPAPAQAPPPPHEAEGASPVVPAGQDLPDGADLRAALESGRIERAHALLASLGDDVPGDADALVEMGTLFLTAGETADAVALLDRAVARDPAHVEARFRRALGRLALGRSAAARADFEMALELSPEGPWAEKARQALEQLPEIPAGETR